LGLGWAATAHPFRAADAGGGAEPGGDRLFVRLRRVTARGTDGSSVPYLVLERTGRLLRLGQAPAIARLGHFRRTGCAEVRMRSFSVNSTPALGRQLNRHTTLGVVLCFNPFQGSGVLLEPSSRSSRTCCGERW
jgi:hypothetical protein